MKFLYDIGIHLLHFGLWIHSFFNQKSKKGIEGRKDYLSAFSKSEIDNNDIIWFHCASLGEFDQGLPLMRLIKEKQPTTKILTTFFSPSGMDHYKKRDHVSDFVCYLPLDTKANAKEFIEFFNPVKAYFVKYEFWINFIDVTKKNDIPLYNISGIFRNDQRFFKWYGGVFRNALRQFNHFFVQNKNSKELLLTIGLNNVTISGDSRFDRVIENKKKLKENEKIAEFKKGSTVFIVGSSWPEDENLIIDYINTTSDKVIIAPHNVSEKHIKGITAKLNRKYALYTEEVQEDSEVLIINTIGQLANAYNYGNYAYVGGGFSGNLHNILEPAVFGLPVIFGPKHSKFPEAKAFIDGGFGFSTSYIEQFNQAITTIKANYNSIQKRELDFVNQNQGASDLIFNATISS